MNNKEITNNAGYYYVGEVDLFKFSSVIAIKDSNRYNILIRKADGGIESIHMLRCKWDNSGSRAVSINRIKVQ